MSVSSVLVETCPSFSGAAAATETPLSGDRDAARRTELTERVRDRLRQSGHYAMRTVTCDDEEGTLVLNGRLPSFYYKQLAQEVVLNVEGVTRLVNRIEVSTTVAS